EVALRTPAGYIGAMGSRRTHADRLARLREAGLSEKEIARLRSPIGLDLGARTPEETAVSVAAELIQLRWGGSGRPLRDTARRIHHGGRAAHRRGAPGGGAGGRKTRRGRTVGWRTVSNRVAGVLLAAGEGKRLGTPKALVELGGRRLVDRGADLLRDGGTAPVL